MKTKHIVIAFIFSALSIFLIEAEINPINYLEKNSKSVYELIMKSEQNLVALEKSFESNLEGGTEGIN